MVVRDKGCFWDLVRRPFLDRALPADVVRQLIERCHREAGRSNREMARLFHLDDEREYKKLTAFLRNHDLLAPH